MLFISAKILININIRREYPHSFHRMYFNLLIDSLNCANGTEWTIWLESKSHVERYKNEEKNFEVKIVWVILPNITMCGQRQWENL